MLVSLSVLVVDDDPKILSIFRRALYGFQGRLRTAASSEEALRSVGSEVPDLLISDLHLGAGAAGVGLLRSVRTSHPTVWCVLHAGSGEDQRSLGVDFDVWAKPCSKQQLQVLMYDLSARREEASPGPPPDCQSTPI